MNEARDDIVDGAGDKQIDAIVIDDNRSIAYVVQGKFLEGEQVDAGPPREVLSSFVQLRNLVKLQEAANQKLKRKLSELARALEDDYELCFELVTTSTLTTSAQQDLAVFQEQLAKLSEQEDLAATISLIDRDELRRRYDFALDRENPSVRHTFVLEPGKYLSLTIAGTRALVAALPLKDCVEIPGIRDGTLFQKNVRQSLGLSNAVNKGIKATIYSENHKDFFFFHNGYHGYLQSDAHR